MEEVGTYLVTFWRWCMHCGDLRCFKRWLLFFATFICSVFLWSLPWFVGRTISCELRKKKKTTTQASTFVKLKIQLKPTFSYNLRFSLLWSSTCLWSYTFWMFEAIFSSMPPFFNNLSAQESKKLWDFLHEKNLHPPWRKYRQIWSLLQSSRWLQVLTLLL